MQLKKVGVIPARYDSTRFPGKPLIKILGKPMVQWVFERTVSSGLFDKVFVATDDDRIYKAVEAFGGEAIITGPCKSGTDRVYQAIKDYDCDIVVNIQGDEPSIRFEIISDLLSVFHDEDVYMSTLKTRIRNEQEMSDPSVVKVVCNSHGDALYFSRALIPYGRDCNPYYYKHIGIYGYRKSFLKKIVELPSSPLEDSEKLEQLRVLDYGYSIRVVETQYDTIGVDYPDDVKRVEKILQEELRHEI